MEEGWVDVTLHVGVTRPSVSTPSSSESSVSVINEKGVTVSNET